MRDIYWKKKNFLVSQAKLLEGVGDNMAAKIGQMIKEQYKEFLLDSEFGDLEMAALEDNAQKTFNSDEEVDQLFQ